MVMMSSSNRIEAPLTDKMKKNTRKLNSGVPAKILIGRPVATNQMINAQYGGQNITGKTMTNFKRGINQSGSRKS